MGPNKYFAIFLVYTLCPGGFIDSGVSGQAASTEKPEDKKQCAANFLEWCQKKEYRRHSGVSMISNSYYNGTDNVQTVCVTDSDGTECRKNRAPWFSCFPNKTLTYEGKPLTTDNWSSADDGLCEAKNMAKFGSRTPFNETAFKEQMEAFHRRMEDFRRRMSEMQNRLFGNNFPFSSGRRMNPPNNPGRRIRPPDNPDSSPIDSEERESNEREFDNEP